MANLWVSGICDSMLIRVKDWDKRWESGKVAATRPFMGKDSRIEDVPTKRAVSVAWRPKELEHLVRILLAVKPQWQITSDLDAFYKGAFRRGRVLPNGLRLAEMITYRADVREILDLLLQVQAGRATGERLNEQIQTGDFWSSSGERRP